LSRRQFGSAGLAALFAATAPSVFAATAATSAPAAGKAAPSLIFVLNSLDANLSVIDPVSLTELNRLPTGKEPHHLYLTPDEKSLMVANALGDSLTLIDPKTGALQRTLTGIVDPYQLRFSPDMKWFVTAGNRLNHVDIYRWEPTVESAPLKLVKRLATGRTPSHLNIDSKSSVVYASVQDSDELCAIDLATQTTRWTIPTGKMPADVYLTADDRTLFLGLTGDEVVEVYDVSHPTAAPKLVKRIKSGAGAHAFRARGDKRHLFVSNRVANTISLIDTQAMTVVDQYPGPGGPDCMDLMADDRTLLVTSRWARKLSIIDTTTRQVTAQVKVGRSPHGVWTLNHAARI
jgi:YVTN family beta-propeller protein